MGYFVKNIGSGHSPYGTTIPTGDTGSRPVNPIPGIMRFNTDSSLMEYFDGVQFVSVVSPGAVSIIVDTFQGDAVQTTFTMSQSESNSAQILVYVGGVYQQPTVSYSVSATDLIFTAAPPLDTAISVVHNIGTIS